jgi:hypothetical protein
MHENARGELSGHLRRVAMAIVAIGAVAAATVHAHPCDNIVLVPPADLDGRTLLYIEQNQGARLATFDVTDPVHIKGNGSVQLDASGPFDFISSLGNQAELVRFRQRQDAVLDLPRMKDPQLKTVQGLTLPAARDYQVLDTVTAYELNRVFDVNPVRAEISKADTGTIFMLTDNGLYVIRRPGVESIHQLMTIPPN